MRCPTARTACCRPIRAGTAYFDLTTNAPSTVRKAHADYAKKGAYLFDAPVSGGPRGAASGKLAIWCGGDAEVFEKWKPVLDTIGDQAKIHRPDRRRFGRQAGAQLLRLHRHRRRGRGVQHGRQGRDRAAGDLGSGAPGRDRPARRVRLADRPVPAQQYEPPAFALRLAHKDVSLATALGRELNVPMRLANLALADLAEGLNRGWGNRDSRAIMVLQTERAGVEVKVDPQRLTEAMENKAKNG